MWLLGIVLSLYLPIQLDSCAATSGTTTTTTASSVTTTISALACASCTLANPAIQVLKVQDGAVDVTTRTVGTNAAGCAIQTIFCVGMGTGSTVFISYNNGAAGTTQGTTGANMVTSDLTCSADGSSWVFTDPTISITQIECDATPATG